MLKSVAEEFCADEPADAARATLLGPFLAEAPSEAVVACWATERRDAASYARCATSRHLPLNGDTFLSDLVSKKVSLTLASDNTGPKPPRAGPAP